MNKLERVQRTDTKMMKHFRDRYVERLKGFKLFSLEEWGLRINRITVFKQWSNCLSFCSIAIERVHHFSIRDKIEILETVSSLWKKFLTTVDTWIVILCSIWHIEEKYLHSSVPVTYSRSWNWFSLILWSFCVWLPWEAETLRTLAWSHVFVQSARACQFANIKINCAVRTLDQAWKQWLDDYF